MFLRVLAGGKVNNVAVLGTLRRAASSQRAWRSLLAIGVMVLGCIHGAGLGYPASQFYDPGLVVRFDSTAKASHNVVVLGGRTFTCCANTAGHTFAPADRIAQALPGFSKDALEGRNLSPMAGLDPGSHTRSLASNGLQAILEVSGHAITMANLIPKVELEFSDSTL
jgi:hypothetical protein